jgi:hypothetical protein
MPGGLRERSADLSQVIADFGLDVWCLAHADPTALDAICERLWAAHGLSYQPIPIGGSCGVLFRPSKTLTAEPVVNLDSSLPPRVRIRAQMRCGSDGEFQIIPVASVSPPSVSLTKLVHSLRRDASASGPDCIFLADAELAFAPGGLASLVEAGGQILVAADQHDGALVLLPGGASPIEQIFISPNLKPVVDLSYRLIAAHDRSLPASLHALNGPRPIALRVTLDRPGTATSRVSNRPALLEPPTLPRVAEGLDDLIERKLRDLLGPVVSKLLASMGNSGKS